MAFKLGDKVKLSKAVNSDHIGKTGVVFEVYPNQLLATGKPGTVYSVRLDSDGTPLGCVTEDCMTVAK